MQGNVDLSTISLYAALNKYLGALTITGQSKKALLLIGSGGYIQQTVLPALMVLAQQFSVKGLINKSGATPTAITQMIPTLRASADLASIDFASIDIIFVCIPHLSVPALLNKMSGLSLSHITLIVCTPVLGIKDGHYRSRFKSFKQTLAFENAFCLPPVVLAKRLIDEGKIGKLKKVYLNHSGYRYHGMALIRSLYNGAYPSYGRTLSFGQYFEYSLKFPGGRHATMLQPKDHAAGYFMLAGSKGIISDHPLQAKNTLVINSLQDETGLFAGLSLNGQPQPLCTLDQLFIDRLPYSRLPDNSLFRQLHIRGAVEIFDACYRNDKTCLYDHSETIYDNVLATLLERVGFWFEPLARFKWSLTRWLYVNVWPLLTRR